MNRSTLKHRSQNKGSLAIALLVVFVMVTISAAFLMRGVNEKTMAERSANASVAFWVSEAGLQKAMWEYNYNNCAGMTHADGQTACNGNKTMAGTLSGYGDFDVTLDSTNTNVTAIASLPGRTAATNVKVVRKVRAVLDKPAIFGHGMFADGQLTITNNAEVDAYDSSAGVYGGSNIDHTNGSVGSNGTTTGIVHIYNNAEVWGDVSTGPGGTVTNTGTIHGDISDTNSIALPAVVVPSSLTSLGSLGVLTIANNATQNLSTGDYKYTKIATGNKSVININGDVRLYLTGVTTTSHGVTTTTSLATGTAEVSLNIASGASLVIYTDGKITFDNNTNINSVAKSPVDLQIYSTYTGSNGISISNNAETYAAVYAPKTDINMSNNSGLYGAVVGKTATLDNNGSVHYDTSLASMANPYDVSILTSWEEYQ